MPRPACAQSASGRLEFGFDEKTGELVSLKSGRFFKTELLAEPLTLDIFRAPSQNEPSDGKRWIACGAMSPRRKLVSFSDVSGDVLRKVVSVVDYAVSGAVFTVTSEWTIKDGAAKLKATFRRTGKEIEPARVGLRTRLLKSDLDVEWLGFGPWENYSDRRSGAFLGLWKLPSAEFFFPYDVPQDCGNREGAWRVKLSSAFDSVAFETLGKPFAFEVCPYAPEVLVRYRHPAELPPNEGTFFGVYAKSRGLGGNSCGPLPLERDKVLGTEFSLELLVR
jgi:beta-galactosidase